MKRVIFSLCLMLVMASFAQAQESPLLLQRPSLSKTHIAFNYAGDLWIFARE